MKIILAAVALFLLGFPVAAIPESPLLGTWQSNAALSINSIDSVRELSPESREAYGRVFGKMTMSFSESNVEVDTGVPGAEAFSRPYKIVSSGPDQITIEFGNPAEPLETKTYFQEGSCMKAELQWKGAYEYWCRVE